MLGRCIWLLAQLAAAVAASINGNSRSAASKSADTFGQVLAETDMQRWPAQVMAVLGFDGNQHSQHSTSSMPSMVRSELPSTALIRHAQPLEGAGIIWAGELLAIVITVVLVLIAVHLQVSQCLGQRRKSLEQAQKMAYPWPNLPPVHDILQVGPSFATNFQSGLRQAFIHRGLTPRLSDEMVLASFLIPAQATGSKKPRAILERHNGVPAGCLGGKRALAGHLQRLRREALAPTTFLSPQVLRKSLEPRVRFTGIVQGVISEAKADGLWFLKHSTMDRNEGVTCYKGVKELLKQWETMNRHERTRYVAQAEVQRPMLLDGHKMMIRAYVITLPEGRCFMNRELLLKGHPMPYDPADPDPLRHVISCVKYDGVVSMRGTAWPPYDKVWPKIAKMMTAVLGAEAVGGGRLPFMLKDDTMIDHVCHRLSQKWQDFADWLRWGRTAGALLYNFMGADIIVDEDLRPWLIELNPGPAMGFDQRDQAATKLRAEVMEDLCELLVDPLLRSVQTAMKSKDDNERWASVRKVPMRASKSEQRGFVEIF
mmetsp:Transcript_61638/g.115246  ORF Transcript_61638/g.115246 Transcript_61638/m.115246 type:complete len:541 (+) Transcript_61638:62-1684(+)